MSHIDEGTLHAYLDGELSEGQRKEIEGHLAICEECQANLEAAEALSGRAAELLAELEPGAVQAPSWREIEERAAARRRAAPRRLRLRPGLAWAASIALAFAIGWVSQGLFLRMPSSAVGSHEIAVRPLEFEPAEAPELRQRAGAEADAAVAETRAKTTEAEEAANEAADRFQSPEAPLAQPAQRVGDDQPGQPAEQDRGAGLADEPVVAQEPAAVAGIEVRAREEGEVVPAVPVDRAMPQPTAFAVEAQRTLAERRDAEAVSTGFVQVSAEDAALWLGTRLRTLPELTLERAEMRPGSVVEGAQPGLLAIRLVYLDAAGNEIVLTQQWVGGLGEPVSEIEPAMKVEPSGHRAYRWLDGQGYLLILEGDVSSDSLRALAERVR